ncbi:alpha/beta fold hydrolase [Agromyces bauzanensis]
MRQQTTPGADGTPLLVHTVGEPRGGDTAILLVHGWARSAAYWAEVAAPLGRDHFVVVPDLRMHGESLLLRNDGVDVSIPLLVQDMRVILAALGVTGCVAVGHSMGGQVVTLLAEGAPELVHATVVLDPAYGALPDEIAAADTRKREHVASAVGEFTDRHPDVSPAIVRRYADALATLYDSEYLLAHSIGAIEATGPVLRRRRRPALAVYATDVGVQTELSLTADAAVPPEVVRWTLGGGHDFPAAHPGPVAELIAEWIARAAVAR